MNSRTRRIEIDAKVGRKGLCQVPQIHGLPPIFWKEVASDTIGND